MSLGTRRLHADSIVVLGSFNPSIFQPAWFAAQGLMTAGEAEDVRIEVIHREIAAFSAEYWDLQCTTDSFSLVSDRAPAAELLRDLTAGIFTLLAHTPLRAVGLNRIEHWEMADENAWDLLGLRLVPPKNWNLLKLPGLRSLTVEGQRPDDYVGYIWVKVEPSARIGHGVFIEVNDHFVLTSPNDVGDAEGVDRASKLVDVLSTEWSNSRDRAKVIINGVINA
jgi:hypothetical protein